MFAPAQDPVVAGGDDHGFDLGMGEAEPLDGVGKLDVDREVVRVALELDLVVLAREWLDLHGQARHVALDHEGPVPVAVGMGLELRLRGRGSGFGFHRRGRYPRGGGFAKQYSA